MSFLIDKSEQNIKSADLLIINKHFASSVHCSYYCCIQLMLHILRTDFNKTEEEIDIESKKGSKDESGFHNWLQNIILREFFIRDFNLGRDFNNYIGSLKGARIKADYKNIYIEQRHAALALQHAKEINKILKEKFTI